MQLPGKRRKRVLTLGEGENEPVFRHVGRDAEVFEIIHDRLPSGRLICRGTAPFIVVYHQELASHSTLVGEGARTEAVDVKGDGIISTRQVVG